MLFFALVTCLSANDTLYFNGPDTVQKGQTYTSYQVKEYLRTDSNVVKEKDFYPSGQPKREVLYSNYKRGEADSFFRAWYPNGNLFMEIQYDKGLYHGKRIAYWANGLVRRRDYLEHGKLIKGNCYTQSGADTTYYEYAVMPEFPGGPMNLNLFLAKNTQYPQKAKENGLSGKVYISFVVSSTGDIESVKVAKGVHPLLDEEAVRVVKSMPKWKPGIQEGKPVNVQYTIPIKFTLQTGRK